MNIEMFRQPLLGIVEEAIAPNQRGRVKFDGTYWPARFFETNCQTTVYPEALVAIVGIQGITLLVEPLEPEDILKLISEPAGEKKAVADSSNRLYWGLPLGNKPSYARIF
ncbi:MAG TPA: NfeD family protein [Oscillatoriaceae cyanobacterium M7585_C2015_266]|nr:NfeD family protein [Oscillatoriaceae cyanobacterium M7585_C2015_266]